MSLKITWAVRAAKQRDRLGQALFRRVIVAIERFAETGQGDVRPLRGHTGEYRLRIGDWRVTFAIDLARREMVILRILPRGDVYKR